MFLNVLFSSAIRDLCRVWFIVDSYLNRTQSTARLIETEGAYTWPESVTICRCEMRITIRF